MTTETLKNEGEIVNGQEETVRIKSYGTEAND